MWRTYAEWLADAKARMLMHYSKRAPCADAAGMATDKRPLAAACSTMASPCVAPMHLMAPGWQEAIC